MHNTLFIEGEEMDFEKIIISMFGDNYNDYDIQDLINYSMDNNFPIDIDISMVR